MRDAFFKYQAQTTPHPLGLEIARAEGCLIIDKDAREHLDLVAGVSACSLGHCHPEVVAAVQEQAATYMHVMVYGETIQKPAVKYAEELCSKLPQELQCLYLVNSGTEAMEAAIKLARRATGRTEIFAAKNAYHGSTLGSLSLMGYEARKGAFRPLLPDVRFLHFNQEKEISKITTHTAAVILETIQGGAGFILPQNDYLKKVRERCDEVGALLVLDEIQPGFGRCGTLFAFEQFNCTPDLLVIGKGMASGMPIGGLLSSFELMKTLQSEPKLGHITTFGGNAVIAAAARATLKALYSENHLEGSLEKEALFRIQLKHPLIKEIRGRGLMLALLFERAEIANFLVLEGIKRRIILFWLLFEPCAVRLTPPLVISKHQITHACQQIVDILDSFEQLGVD
ncbi:aspartate aminotransferase family protein [Aureicoccus marinus]|uniref:Aspartate aminotransferase family protein n=1 Tax=Aureicoccus marinus TaxID=754435 RepID=A0A2S7T506_9FLAO|nr:aminotransferase class III-fold pyridoxal phosphate-dependent enzyme [Aureicoccus marinus]PQJ14688.1 aspartate aminotransferase family protein [Aureicoccus marinus]